MIIRHFLCRLLLPTLGLALLPFLAGCLGGKYYVDPKPARVGFEQLHLPASPKPVQLVFDVYNENGPFPEATKRLAPTALEVVRFSGLFSSVAKVGSDNMPRLTLVLTERELPEAGTPVSQPLPPNITVGLANTRGGVIYTLTGTYQPAGKPAVKQVYNHAVHVAGTGSKPAGVKSMPAMSAVQDVVEQMLLAFLLDLQKSGAL